MKLMIKLGCVLCLMLPLLACARQEAVATTQTNEQGCTRIRSVGPQDPFKEPPPLKQACLGPYLLEIPQNYFYNQIGTEHDGSYALALEYPSLQPFKPGERMGLTFDISVRTVTINYNYVDRVDVQVPLRLSYDRGADSKNSPEDSLDSRVEGASFDGLTPYYIDMESIRKYYRSNGKRESAAIMQPGWHTDWFLARDKGGEVQTVIKCTARAVTDSGVEYRDGKMVKNASFGVARCEHIFVVAELDTLVRIKYPREGMRAWQKIEARARDLLTASMKNKDRESKP